MVKSLFYILLFLKSVDANPNVITSFYELIGSGTATSTKYVAAPTGSATVSALTTSTISDSETTYVHIRLPSGDGEPSSPLSTVLNTDHIVLVTYPLCTSTSSSTSKYAWRTIDVDVAVPPVTKTIPIALPSDVAATLTPTATQVVQLPNLNSVSTSLSAGVLNLQDVDPVEFAWLSRNYQPENCLINTATSTVNYRDACKNGPPGRNANVSMSCGEQNPCCFDCQVWLWSCQDPPCGILRTADDYAYCADGFTYYSDGESSVHSGYTMDAPTVTAGEWTDEQRENDRDLRKASQPTETGKSAAGSFIRDGAAAFFTFCRIGVPIISAAILCF